MRVYDVADCGPRNRYTVLTSDGPLIVHNCVLGLGYSMGPERFVEYAAGYGLELTQERATEIVTQWREANSNISGLWRRIDDCVKEAINSAERSPAKKALVRINAHLLVRVSPARNGQPLLTIQLPSGRRLFYRNIGFDEDPRKDRPSLAFDGYSKMWGRQFTYAAKLFENINQAFARDVLCEMMLEIERRELGEIVLTVHDEVLVEVPDEVADERFAAINEIMNTTPSWAPGLAVKAAGSVMGRYAK
jgi:DNA polymerase